MSEQAFSPAPRTASPPVFSAAPDRESGRLEHAFVRHAARTPDRLALLYRGEQLSYRELDQWSNQVAHHLRSLGIGRETRVAVALDRSPQLIAALLAVLKAGAAYVPIDPGDPDERRAFVLRDSEASLLLTDGAAPAAFAGAVCDLAADSAAIAAMPVEPLVTPGDHRDLANILYTSGSTGTPKGVMLEHSAKLLIDWMIDEWSAETFARVAATSSTCFDPSVCEIFAPLSTGGCIILKQNMLEPFDPQEQPTFLQGIPSVLDELARNGAIPNSVRIVNVGGEALSGSVAQRIYRGSRIDHLYNTYGPTEATVLATRKCVDRDGGDPSIGTAVAGARIHLLDQQGKPVGTGQTGEIYIAGSGVARGYWNRPDLTRERFVAEPGAPAGSRMYRTGDLARLMPGGELMFIGRTERQVKIRGCRVELGEVEQALCRLPRVNAAAVLVMPDRGRKDRLVAFVQTEGAFDVDAARAALARWLPRVMVPSRIVAMTTFPRNGSDKIDYNALKPLLEEPCDEGLKLNDCSALEAVIADEMGRLLARTSVAPEDDFFDLGGDSLGAFQLAMALEERLGRSINPVLIAQATSPRALGTLLETIASHRHAGDHLSLLAAGDAGPPVFCVPGVSGEPVSFASIARHLSSSIYGLSPGPLTEAFIESPDLGRLTAAYADAIQRLKPDGPYVVAGYSFGGIAAVDLACTLERSGHRVTLLLIDGYLGRNLTAPRTLLPWAARHGLTYMREEGGRALIAKIRRSRWLPWGKSGRAVPPWVSPDRYRIAEAMIKAAASHRLSSFNGRTIMIRADQRGAYDRLLDHDGRQGWGDWLTGEVAVRAVTTTHLGLMRHPHVLETARIVDAECASRKAHRVRDPAFPPS